MDQIEIMDLLKSHTHKVLFMKKNGEIRTIVGSLPADAVPHNDTAVPIVELETGLWKSFTLSSVIEIAPA